jgi:hypothetical protein
MICIFSSLFFLKILLIQYYTKAVKEQQQKQGRQNKRFTIDQTKAEIDKIQVIEIVKNKNKRLTESAINLLD